MFGMFVLVYGSNSSLESVMIAAQELRTCNKVAVFAWEMWSLGCGGLNYVE